MARGFATGVRRGVRALSGQRTGSWRGLLLVGAFAALAGTAVATPDFVTHQPLAQVYGEPGDVTMREPDAPREGEAIGIWARVGYRFFWDAAAIYYTTDGTDPTGSFGTATNGTAVAMGWVRNEPAGVGDPDDIDWLRGVLPSQAFGTEVRYSIGVWNSGGGIEVFANNTGCSDDICDTNPPVQTVFSYTALLPWPGRGYPNADPDAGFPNIHFWKEEGVVGNNYINVMIDQNGTLYDVYYPSAGCVQGVGTRNEGYVDGLDTFPALLPPGWRGQMHINQAQAGIRIDGTTYWLSNEAGNAYDSHAQAYVPDNNVISTASRLVAGGNSIVVDQYDFCPKGIAYPDDSGSQPIRGIYVKRYLLTNTGASSKTVDFYYAANFALNGGDDYDGMYDDKSQGAMVAYDNTYRLVSGTGAGPWSPGNEYNPTSFGTYEKNVSVYLAAAMKLCDSVGSATGTVATDSWRDSSSDNDAGWVGLRLTLDPGQTREIDVAVVGGFENQAGQSGTYGYFIQPGLNWFHATSMAAVQAATETYWTDWLAAGVGVDLPGEAYDALYRRGLLATALHIDGLGGGVIAGMHNGAYPFVWPRDALYAAVTLDRTGHTAEAGDVFRFLRDTAYRAEEEPGRKGFWYQKYTTDGYIVWNAPQVDETANVTWAAWYHYLTTGDLGFLSDSANYQMFYEAGRAMSEDSSIDSRLYYDDTNQLMHSNNVWEDSWDEFLYSNATVERGLRDAARIATATGNTADAALFATRADAIHAGLNGRLDWDGENTDISQLGLVWPFETHSPLDARITHVVDRINGVATDRWGNNHPLVNYSGEWEGLINRYWDDTYWWHNSGPNAHGSPWFLTTLWYGQYYAKRQDHNPGKGDIDNFKYRLDLTADQLGPIGLGAEQMAPQNSLLYAGQTDFLLETAWPNAWESMSFITDCVMLFLDHVPDAPGNTLKLAPKLPTGWDTMTYRNVPVGAHRIDVTSNENDVFNTHVFTNVTGGAVNYDTYVRIPEGETVVSVWQDESTVSYTFEPGPGRVHLTGPMNTGADALTVVKVVFVDIAADFDKDGDVDGDDLEHFEDCATGPGVAQAASECADARLDGDDDVDADDLGVFQRCLSGENVPADTACAS